MFDNLLVHVFCVDMVCIFYTLNILNWNIDLVFYTDMGPSEEENDIYLRSDD